MRADVAAESEDCGQVHLDDLSIAGSLAALPAPHATMTHLVPVIIRELGTWMPALNSCAIHQDCDLVSVFEDCRSEGCYFGLRGEVCGVDCRFAAESFDGF